MKIIKRVRLGDLVNLQTGPFGTQFSASEYVDEGIPVINVKNIGAGRIINENLDYISEKTRDRLCQHVLKNGDIVFGRKGSIDRHAYIFAEQDGWVQGSDCIRARGKCEIDTLFLSQYLEGKNVKKQIMDSAVGSTMPSLNTDIINNIIVLLPGIDEQRKISHNLGIIDKKIELNNKLNDNLQHQLKLIYDYWFTQFDFPDEKGKPYKSCGGLMNINPILKQSIPYGWEVKNIRDIASITWGQCPEGKNILPSSSFGDDLLDYCSGAGDMKGGFLVNCQAKTDNSRRLAHENDILVSVAGKIGDMCFVDHTISLGRAAMAYTANNSFEIPFVYMTLKSLNKKMSTISSGSIQKVINNDNVDDFNFAYSVNVTKAFSNVATPIFNELTRVSHENHSLIKLRKWLLPVLMNGQATIED